MTIQVTLTGLLYFASGVIAHQVIRRAVVPAAVRWVRAGLASRKSAKLKGARP